MTAELPAEAVEEAERLTRLARGAATEEEAAAYTDARGELLAEHGYAARVRAADETLVLYPEEWLAAGEVQLDRVEDLDRAVEVSLAGPGDPDDWAAVEEHNAAVVERVRAAHGPVHAANARAFADFMGNHYAKPVEDAAAAEVEEFLGEYFPRNAWPDEEQVAVVEGSLRRVFAAADADPPPPVADGDGESSK